MIEKIKRGILQGKYENIEKLCEEMELNQIRDILLRIAFDTGSISVYGFVQYMAQSSGKEKWIELMIEILMNPLCHIEGAYSMALFYSKEVLKKARTAGNLERIIFFYEIPEKLISYEEAKEIAEEIIKLEPNNKTACSILR